MRATLPPQRVAGTIDPICRLDVDTPDVVLTFDDGPGAYTSRFAAVLRRERVPAAFFWRGDAARPGLDFAATLVRDGHQIGSHAVSHRCLTGLRDEDLQSEIREAGRILRLKSGVPIRHLRPPFGAYDGRTLACAHRCGMAVVLWNVDTLDWDRAEVPHLILESADQVVPGSIVLMHEREQTLAILPAFIGRLRSAGYRFRLLPAPSLRGGA